MTKVGPTLHYACPSPGGGFEPACSPPSATKDPTKFSVTPSVAHVTCKRCLSWLKET